MLAAAAHRPAVDRFLAFEAKDDPAVKIRSRLSAGNATVRAASLNAIRSFPGLWTEQAVHESIERCLGDSDPQARSAACPIGTGAKGGRSAELRSRKALDDPEPRRRASPSSSGIASEVGLKKDLRLLGVVSNSLVDVHTAAFCEKCFQLIQSQPALVANAAIENGLRELVVSAKTADRQREIAKALLATRGRSSSGAGDANEAARPGLFSGQRCLPIFNHVGEDGQELHGLPSLAHDLEDGRTGEGRRLARLRPFATITARP